ncbi:MAG: hypothetical protein DRP84_05325 [Spirochaetes bacterium]|nr:MAG: hypothetical protein DRP84_05325 [Spirochaetota bacterium]
MKMYNDIRILDKKKIKDLLKSANSEWNIYAPIEGIGGDVYFDILPKDDKIVDEVLNNLSIKNNSNIALSPKDIFFPQMEVLFNIDKDDFTETIESSPKLIFGIKSCDLKAVLFTDEFFKRNYEDVYYLSRMKNRLLISIGCLTPPRPGSCFCTSTGTGPFLEEGYDIQLVDAEDFFYAEIGSEKGQIFADKYSEYFDKRTDGDTAKKDINKIKTKASDAVNLKVDFDRAVELMQDDDFFPNDNYKRIGERCIYCGACLYTCPTCTCFSISDTVSSNKEGIRFRNWDGCVFEGYTREASGHNPRYEKYLRTARRYEHKLKYDFKVTGTSGCVGCGRCLESCPVNIGMSKFIVEITEGKRII